MAELLQYYFETILSYISERSLTLKPANMTSKWLSSVLRFSSARIPAAEDKLFVLCAMSYKHFTVDDVIDFSSRVMSRLSNRVNDMELKYSADVIILTDWYLNYQQHSAPFLLVSLLELCSQHLGALAHLMTLYMKL